MTYESFTVPNKSFELRRCSNYRKSNYRESTVLIFATKFLENNDEMYMILICN